MFARAAVICLIALSACVQGPGESDSASAPSPPKATVQDPEGFRRQVVLECPQGGPIASSILDYTGYETGEHGEPEEIVREGLEGLRPDDRMFNVGHPQTGFRSVAIERENEVIAKVSLTPTEDGGWVIGEFEACDSARIRV